MVPGGCAPRGVSGPKGGDCSDGGGSAIPACTEEDPNPVNRMTDRQV